MKKNVIKTLTVLSTVTVGGTTLLPVAASAASSKTINWLESADLTTMDPSLATDNVAFDALVGTGEGLYRISKEGKPKLALAKSVDVSDDKKTYTFHLRDGLKWSNGDALTAKDFVYGWQRTNDPKTASQYAYLYVGILNAEAIQAGTEGVSDLGVSAPDDSTVVVKLAEPMPQLKSILTMAPFFPQNQKFVESAGDKYGTDAEHTLANGPFVLKGWTGSNAKYSLEKNPNYYDKKVVKASKIVISTIKDANTAYNLYKSKKTDFTTLSTDQVSASKSDSAYRNLAESTTFYLELNEQKQAIFKNEKARQAISYAMNRKQLSSKILTGTATPATTLTSAKLVKDPNSGKDFAKAATKKGVVTYDLKKAQKLWKEALSETGTSKLSLELLTDDTSGAKKTAQYVQSNLEKLSGLDITIKTVPFKQRLAASQDHNFDIVISAWGADYADPSTFLDLMTSDSSFNNGLWSSSEYDSLVNAAATTDVGDSKARFTDLIKAEQIIDKEAGVVPLYYRSTAALLRTSVKDVINTNVGAKFDWKYAYKK